jgi:hypothetical protein
MKSQTKRLAGEVGEPLVQGSLEGGRKLVLQALCRGDDRQRDESAYAGMGALHLSAGSARSRMWSAEFYISSRRRS